MQTFPATTQPLNPLFKEHLKTPSDEADCIYLPIDFSSPIDSLQESIRTKPENVRDQADCLNSLFVGIEDWQDRQGKLDKCTLIGLTIFFTVSFITALVVLWSEVYDLPKVPLTWANVGYYAISLFVVYLLGKSKSQLTRPALEKILHKTNVERSMMMVPILMTLNKFRDLVEIRPEKGLKNNASSYANRTTGRFSTEMIQHTDSLLA